MQSGTKHRVRKALHRGISLVSAGLVLAGSVGRAQMPAPPSFSPRLPDPAPAAAEAPARDGESERLISLKFLNTPLDTVLDQYGEIVDRTILKTPNLNANISLRSHTKLTVEEYKQAIQTILAMNNITLVPMGEKFLKVVQPAAARTEGMPIHMILPEEGFEETDELISQVIILRHVEIAEVQPIIQPLLHGYGKIQPLERANGMLVTATAANLNRILEILELLDQPAEMKIETRIYELQYAEAAKIASRLQELIKESQGDQKQPERVAPAPVRAPPGIIRAQQPQTEQQEAAAAQALAERGIIRGEVRIVADERTNILFIFSQPENFVFFDRIISVLDRPVDPAIRVRVVALEFADAEEIAGILNEFIGAASADSEVPVREGGDPADARSKALREYVEQRAQQREPAADEGAGTIGRLSSSTKILADKRTNSLLLMGRKNDLFALADVIHSLDVMLEQVLIEAVILEVNLGENLEHGIDWLQRSMTVYNEQSRGPGGALTVRQPVMSFAGGQSVGGSAFQDASSLTDRSIPLGSGITYYTTFFDLNLDAVIRLAADSRDVRILSTPVILTTDNTEAKINISEQRPVVTSSSTTSAGEQRSTYEYRDIGIQLTVTPRINPARFVVMEINQAADELGGTVSIDDNEVPIILKREMEAQIAVGSRETIALGGLVRTDRAKSSNKVPLLGDIPLLGALFRSDSRSETRTELLVLITPYVLSTPEEARAETRRLREAATTKPVEWHHGWSDSPLAPEEKKSWWSRKRGKEEDDSPAEAEPPVRRESRPLSSVEPVEPDPRPAPAEPPARETPARDAPVEPRPATPEPAAAAAPGEWRIVEGEGARDLSQREAEELGLLDTEPTGETNGPAPEPERPAEDDLHAPVMMR